MHINTLYNNKHHTTKQQTRELQASDREMEIENAIRSKANKKMYVWGNNILFLSLPLSLCLLDYISTSLFNTRFTKTKAQGNKNIFSTKKSVASATKEVLRGMCMCMCVEHQAEATEKQES